MTRPDPNDVELVRQALDASMDEVDICAESEQGPCNLCRKALEKDPRAAFDRLLGEQVKT